MAIRSDSIELGGQQFHGRLQQIELVRALHRAGHIDQKHEVGRRLLVGKRTLDADVKQLALRVPRTGSDLRIDGEGFATCRGRIGVGEIVDQFLDTNRVLPGQVSAIDPAPGVAVGRRVHVDGEGRHGILRGQVHRIGVEVRIGFPVVRYLGHADIGEGGHSCHLFGDLQAFGAPDHLLFGLGGWGCSDHRQDDGAILLQRDEWLVCSRGILIGADLQRPGLGLVRRSLSRWCTRRICGGLRNVTGIAAPGQTGQQHQHQDQAMQPV